MPDVRTAARTRTAAALALAGALLLTGCTGGGGDDGGSADGAGGPAPAGEAAEGGASTDPGAATVADQVMAEQKIATPHGGGDAWGGEVTVTLRSVEVAGGTTTVRWALRWDDDEAPADAGASYYDLGVEPSTTVTDREGLKAYRPFCTEGAWQSDTEDPAKASLEQMRCRESMLVSPLENITFAFPNHGTIEVSAVLPAPEGEPATVDVLPGEGLPLFTDATVTYVDGGAE
jgi:hypothetical protein